MWVAPCSWRTRISLILESTSASKIGIAAPPDRPKTYSTPSRSRHRIRASAPVCAFLTATGGAADVVGVDCGALADKGIGGDDKAGSRGCGGRGANLSRIQPKVDTILTSCSVTETKWSYLTQCTSSSSHYSG